MLVLVVAVFAICWLPIHAFHILTDAGLVPFNYQVFMMVSTVHKYRSVVKCVIGTLWTDGWGHTHTGCNGKSLFIYMRATNLVNVCPFVPFLGVGVFGLLVHIIY